MLSINTNLSSLIAQNSMRTSTNKLNQAIERMTTGSKINHASDNAANYSISTNMQTRMSALRVAEDNTLQGLEMLNTASETLGMMSDLASRLRSLATQAQNGTYDATSLSAINAEAHSITGELNRLFKTASYNGIKLLDSYRIEIPDGIGADVSIPASSPGSRTVTPQTTAITHSYNEFIDNPITYSDAEVAAMTSISEVTDSFTSGKTYSISSAVELEKLATLVNNGIDTTNITFVLGNDIDLSSISNWTPIGNASKTFKGTFDGNGHVISDLTIADGNYRGLFGYLEGATVVNLAISNCDITGYQFAGGVSAYAENTIISNCYVEGELAVKNQILGGLVGQTSNCTISNCYVDADLTFKSGGHGSTIGGLVGACGGGTVTGCYSIGSLVVNRGEGGGCFARAASIISNCYSKMNITGKSSAEYVGGFAGHISTGANVENCYSTGNVVSEGNITGGFVGFYADGTIRNCYSKSNVTSTGEYTGGFCGKMATKNLYDCIATGNVAGNTYVGGLTGYSTGLASNCSASGNVKGSSYVGGLIGYQLGHATRIINCTAKGSVTADNYVGGLVGLVRTYDNINNSAAITNSVSLGEVNGNNAVGSFIGGIANTADGINFKELAIANSMSVSSSGTQIGGVYKYADSTLSLLNTYDKSTWTQNIISVRPVINTTTLQIGANAGASTSITFDTKFDYEAFGQIASMSMNDLQIFEVIDGLINSIDEKQVELGAVQNRLESALDEISTQYENLVSSHSTIKDADMAKVSSQYIQQQILQDAGATLLASTQNIQAQNVLGLIQSLRG